MKILSITEKKFSHFAQSKWEEYGIHFEYSSPTPLSALTAMKISKDAERFQPVYVLVTRQKDAVAAISAKKISKHPNFKIIYLAEPNSAVPRVIHKPVIQNVDSWIFPSQRLAELYPDNLRNKTIIEHTAISDISLVPPIIDKDKITISWIGRITDTERLKKILEKVDELDGKFTLRISGGGIARDVMPAVRYSRGLDHKDKVIWIGEEYNLEREISESTALVASDKDLSDEESTARQSCRAILNINEIEDFINAPYALIPQDNAPQDKYIERFRQALLNC